MDLQLLERAFQSVEWGSDNENNQLYRVGQLIAAPDIGIPAFRNYEAMLKGEKNAELPRPNHWEIKASEIAGALTALTVFRNHDWIIIKHPFIEEFSNFIIFNHFYVKEEMLYDKEKILQLRKKFEKFSKTDIHENYIIKIKNKKYTVTYENGIHPYIYKVFTEINRYGEYEYRDIMLQLMENMHKLMAHNY